MNLLNKVGTALGLAGLLVVALTGTAAAHKVRVFATVEGDVIQGYGYFSKSSKAKNCQVTIYGPKGGELGRTTTDQQGEFTFKPKYKCDHKLVLNAGEGHRAEFVIEAAELPDNLAPYEEEAKEPAPEEKAQKEVPPAALAVTGVDVKELEAVVATAVAKEMAPLKKQLTALRQQLNNYGDKIRWHDVLGGIGFIVGFAGIWLLAAGRRKSGKG